jgi:hypothetical protein
VQVSRDLSVAPVVELARVDPVEVPGPVELEVAADIVPGVHETESCLLADEPWVCGVQGFAAPPTPQEAFPGPAAGEAPRKPPGFLGRAVGGIHYSVQFWKETFESDVYVENILQYGYKFQLKCLQRKPESFTGRETTRAPGTKPPTCWRRLDVSSKKVKSSRPKHL